MKQSGTPVSGCLVYSVVLPVFNERENIGMLLAEIADAMQVLHAEYEVLLVDDKSADGSLDIMRNLAQTSPRYRVIEHVRRCGQSAALASGFKQSRGEIIITLDSDGQNNPADIPTLVKALTDGVDAVCGVRMNRQDTQVKKLSSRVANRFRNWITGENLQDAGCNFRVMRKEALAELPVFNGMHRFLPQLLRYQGFRVVEVPVSHRPRIWGDSKYGINNRMWRGLVDCLVMRWWRKRIIPGRRSHDDRT